MLDDPVAGVVTNFPVLRDRRRLISDLACAVQPDNGRSVLVLFGFEGLREHLEDIAFSDGEKLLEQIAAALTRTLAGTAQLYASRRGEFCGLYEGGISVVRSLLVTVPVELDTDLRSLSIHTSLGIAVLPDEATDPFYALSLADRRLRALSGNVRPTGTSEWSRQRYLPAESL